MISTYKTFLILALLFSITLESRFDITSNAKCAKQENGNCVQWQQIGQVVEQVAACFPQDTFVLTKERGFIWMKDLHLGQHILSYVSQDCIGYQCQYEFSQVVGWLHRDQKTFYDQYLYVVSDNGNAFTVSPKHNIGVFSQEEDLQYIFAENLKGRQIFTTQISFEESSIKIQSVSKISKRGLYTPLTQSNNFYVFKQTRSGTARRNDKVLAHCYAHIENPTFYEPIVDTIIGVYEFVYGRPEQTEIMHPAAKWMENQFGFLVEGVEKETMKKDEVQISQY